MVIAPTHPCPWRLGNRIQRQNTYGVQLSIGIADIFQIAHLDTTRHPASGAAGRDGCDFCWGAIYLWSGQIIVCHPPWFPSNKGISGNFPQDFFLVGVFGCVFGRCNLTRYHLSIGDAWTSDLTILYLLVIPRSKDASGKEKNMPFLYFCKNGLVRWTSINDVILCTIASSIISHILSISQWVDTVVEAGNFSFHAFRNSQNLYSKMVV